MKQPVANKRELLTLLRQHSAQIHGYGVRKLSLFGSFVRDKDIHEGSDIDFIVEFRDEDFSARNYFDLAYFLEDLLGRTVELIQPQYLSRFIAPRVLKELEDVGLQTSSTIG